MTALTHTSQRLRRGLVSAAGAIALTGAGLMGGLSTATAEETYRIGIVTFLSGPASGPFGVPAANAARLLVDELNAGNVPAPYDTVGMNGVRIQAVLIDEAGGPSQQVEEYRNLVQRQNVDAVIGYISSGDCLAIAPVAEDLETITVMFDCGTSRLFLENPDSRYVFRTGLDAAADNIAAVHYMKERHPDARRIAGIQQNYAWGTDSWNDFTAALEQIMPETEIVESQMPRLFQGSYGTEISVLQTRRPDIIHSSFWGGDMEAFVLQANARGLLQNATALLTTGESGLDRFNGQAPNGTILGGRGPFGAFAPENELNNWFTEAYRERFEMNPTYPSTKMAQAIFGLKHAIEKAANGASGKPDKDAVADAFRGATFESPSGTVEMSRAGGHQAMQSVAYGEYHYENGEARLENVISYRGECITPPDGVAALDWIADGMPDAECD
ncbi:MAG: ABC transporter substrate-binding protein [Ectothiorhodospiraceae bacterium]|nr:ABC transporter substrate-binding protein [Ectothiorhodospiraceae bacterium]